MRPGDQDRLDAAEQAQQRQIRKPLRLVNAVPLALRRCRLPNSGSAYCGTAAFPESRRARPQANLRIAATEVMKTQRNAPIRSLRSRPAREVAISQIAEAFIVPNAAMEQGAACCARGDRRGTRAAFAPYRFEPFTWSGYVIVVLNEWLREHAIGLARSSAPRLRNSCRSIIRCCAPKPPRSKRWRLASTA